MKKLLLLAACISSMGAATAQTGTSLVPENWNTQQQQQQSAWHHRVDLPRVAHPLEQAAPAAKTNSIKQRMIASTNLEVFNLQYRYDDSAVYSYSNGRGYLPGEPFKADGYKSYVYLTNLNQFRDYNEDTYSYNSSNQVTDDIYRLWDAGTQALKNYLRATYQYDGAGNLTEYVHFSWDDVNSSWKKASKVTYAFDGQQRVISENYSEWNGMGQVWKYTSGYDYTYTTTKPASKTYKTWDNNTNAWRGFSRYTFSYGANDNMITEKYEIWNQQISNWKNSQLTTCSYNANNLMEQRTLQTWNDQTSNWKNYSKSLYNYNAGNLVESVVSQEWDANFNFWENDYQTLNTYDGQQNRTSEKYQQWVSGLSVWIDQSGYLYVFDAGNHKISEIEQQADNNQVLKNKRRKLYTYTAEGLESSMRQTTWSGNMWIPMVNDYGTNYWYESYEATAVANSLLKADLRLYPNPATNNLHIQASFDEPVAPTLTVNDMSGRRLISRSHGSTTSLNESLDISSLPAGTYQLTIRSGNAQRSERFSVTK